MSGADPRVVSALLDVVAEALAATEKRPVVIGICGAQGSGKSTLSQAAADALLGQGQRVAVLSLDDLYLTPAERQVLAREVHPLFATRGVPGTHDVELGHAVLDALELIDISNNIGDSRSLMCHPASSTHHNMGPEGREAMGIGEGMLRLNVGLEDPQDLIADLDQALA